MSEDIGLCVFCIIDFVNVEIIILIMSRGEISESIKVYIRERPDVSGFTSQENGAESQADRSESGVKNVSEDKKSCTYYSASNKVQQTFTVDKYFDPSSEQSELFETIALPIVESAFLGYSGTILAYGPTSSGKTHTMRGGDGDLRGIMPRYAVYYTQYIIVIFTLLLWTDV